MKNDQDTGWICANLHDADRQLVPYLHLQVCMYVCTCMCTCGYMHTYMCVGIIVSNCACVCAWVHAHATMFLSFSLCIFVCMYSVCSYGLGPVPLRGGLAVCDLPLGGDEKPITPTTSPPGDGCMKAHVFEWHLIP